MIASGLLAAAPVAAQPISLAPPPTPSPATAPPATAPPAPAAQSPAGDDQIQVAPLQPVDTSWIGLLGPAQGGFPQNMWNGASRSFVAATLPQLQPVTSPELVNLARRLLLSDAAAPPGNDVPGEPTLLAERIDRIDALGFVTDGLALIESLPSTAVVESIDRDRVELRFAANDSTGACQDVETRIAHYPGPWWARALIACQALTGDFAKASFGERLLADQKAPADPEFDTLIRSLASHGSVRIARLGDPTPLRLTLFAATKRPLPAEAIAIADPAALAGYASNNTVTPEDRLAAAERAEALGVLSPQSLAKLYDAIAFKPEELARARKSIRPPADARDRALLYVLAKSGSDFTVRMAAIEALAADAEKHGVFVPRAPLLAPTLADIPGVNVDPKFAGVAARILLASGAGDAAKQWVNAASDKATAMLSLLAQPGIPRIDAGLARATASAAGEAGRAARANLLYALLTALGADPATLSSLAPDALAAPVVPGAVPNAALWEAQQQAAQNNQLGTTVLGTLLIAESDGRLTAEPLLLGRAVAGLHAVGLDADAHALALEAALNAGI